MRAVCGRLSLEPRPLAYAGEDFNGIFAGLAQGSCDAVISGTTIIPERAAIVFPPAEARRILRRLEFHYVPKHASWLNIVEIEIGVLRGQCLDRRIDDPKRLASGIAAWERQRNAAKARINWMFTTEKARAKLGPAYPDTSKES